MRTIHWLALVLVLVGALNWGLIGFFNFNLVSALFGDGSGLSRLIYALVGLSAIWIGANAVSREMPATRMMREHR